MATDQPPGSNIDKYSVESDQHADSLDRVLFPGLVFHAETRCSDGGGPVAAVLLGPGGTL